MDSLLTGCELLFVESLLQLVCLATFLKVSESDSFDPYQVIPSFRTLM